MNKLSTLLLIGCTLLLGACQNTKPQLELYDAPDWQVQVSPWHCFPLDKSALDEKNLVTNFPAGPDDDIWPSIQENFSLDYVDNSEVKAQLRFYSKHPDYLVRVQEKASRYLFYIMQVLQEHDIPSDFALLPIVESAYRPFAYSHGSASGLWQFIPMTGRRFQLEQNWWYDGRRDVVDSTEAAARYLRYLYRFFDNDWQLALAAYNAGEGTVRRALEKNKRLHKATDFWHLDLPAETSSYVPKLIALVEIFRHPEKYKMPLVPISNRPYFVEVKLDSQLDLMQAAELAGISIDELYYLNPGFNRWATPPGDEYSLKVPIENRSQFEQALAQLPKNERVTWRRYEVIKGDSLNSIARKFNSDIDWIKRINKLHSSIIVIGQSLMIPVSSANIKHYRYSQTQRLKSKQNTAPASGKKQILHTVQAGDTFWSISRQYKVDYKDLARWNNKAPADTLHTGEQLAIWVNKNSAQAYSPRQGKIANIRYRVRKGDSLAKIARKFSVSVKQIRQWNQLDINKYLQPGQTLKLSVNVMDTSH